MKLILLAVFSGVFFLLSATCSAAEMETEIKRAPVVKSVWPKYRPYRLTAKSKSKRKTAAPAVTPSAITVSIPQNNDKISGDVIQSWQPYSYP